jgi:hypothetical protein
MPLKSTFGAWRIHAFKPSMDQHRIPQLSKN